MIWKDVGMWHIEHINYLYHGTDARFNNISLDKAKAFKDFGKGFYLTSIPEQAVEWARSRGDQHRNEQVFVYKYRVNTAWMTDEFAIKECRLYSEEWLELIYRCRMGVFDPPYDIIYDRMADGRINETLEKYRQDKLSALGALQDLTRWRRKRDQYCFKTEKACALLEREGVISIIRTEDGTWGEWNESE